MKFKTTIISSALALAAFMPAGADAKSYKRGVAESNFTFIAQMQAIEPGVSWFYNWGPGLNGNLADQQVLEFIPMCWNGGWNEGRIRDYVKAHPETKYLLGFNEPNFTNQANMTPQAAAERWPALRALADELGLKVVAPAMNYSPNPPYQSPTAWFDEFVALVGEDAFDFLAIHSYGGTGVMKDLATTFHNRYHKPVWVTEFCYWPGESQNTYVAPETQIAQMIDAVQWLEKTDWIYRYAWFMATGNSSASSGPNYGLILSGRGEEPRKLSNQGLVYVNMPDFDPEVYNQPNEFIPVQNFINSSGVQMTANADKSLDFPLEFSVFNAGAYADYQFELTGESATALVIRAGGYGEPTRFNPTLTVCMVNDDETEGEQIATPLTITNLPNDNETFIDIAIPINLAPGRHRIRLKDNASWSPSGIVISGIKLMTPSSVETISGESALTADVYTVEGVCVRKGADAAAPLEGLPAGLYIVNGKKLLKK